jgi:hypothetical protein
MTRPDFPLAARKIPLIFLVQHSGNRLPRHWNFLLSKHLLDVYLDRSGES